MRNKIIRMKVPTSNNTTFILRNKYLLFHLVLLFANLMIPTIWFIVRRLLDKKQILIKEPSSAKQESISFTSYVSTHNTETPPLIMGPQRLHYQYAVVLPQTYLTLISVLQGIVFAGLLTHFPLPDSTSLKDIYDYLYKQYLLLPYFTSSMIILIVWSQLVNAILFLVWPFSAKQSTLIFIISLVELLAFLNINSFLIWLFGLGWIGIIGAIIRFNNVKLLLKEEPNWVSPLHGISAYSRKNESFQSLFYFIIGIVVLVLSLILGYSLPKSINDVTSHSVIHWIIFIVFAIVSLSLVIVQLNGNKDYLREIIKESDLILSSQGILSYKKGDERDNSLRP